MFLCLSLNQPFGDMTMTKDELLSKIQSSIDEQQAKLTELKNRAKDESHEAVNDIRAAIDELEPNSSKLKPKQWKLPILRMINGMMLKTL
jgi:signal transduction histidine kinase